MLVGLIATAFRPAQAALLPNIARTPEELTAANVASSTIESVTMFGGPALGGLVLAVTSTSVVFAMSAAAFVWSAVLVSSISGARDRPQAAERKETVVSAALAGFRTVLADRRVRLLVGLFSAQTLVAGALNVLVVVTALELLDLGESGVGYLYSAVGIGGLVGAAASLALVGRRRLAFAFGLGVLAGGLPIALIAASSSTGVTLILLGIVGLANTVVDVAGLTLLQRAVPDDVLARVFGALETFMLATVALGSALAPLLVSTLGTRAALVVVGCSLPALVLLLWRRLAEVEAAAPIPGRGLELLQGVPFLAGLPAPTLEHLAGSLTALTLPSGSRVFAAGERGDSFYVIDDGEVEISAEGRRLAVCGPRAYFGEIALLRDVPRTATVTARSDVSLYLLHRDEFVAAVTGHAPSREAADAVVASRLSSLRPGYRVALNLGRWPGSLVARAQAGGQRGRATNAGQDLDAAFVSLHAVLLERADDVGLPLAHELFVNGRAVHVSSFPYLLQDGRGAIFSPPSKRVENKPWRSPVTDEPFVVGSRRTLSSWRRRARLSPWSSPTWPARPRSAKRSTRRRSAT